MNVPSTKVLSVAQLYPVTRDDSIRALLQTVLAGYKNMDGTPALTRVMTPEERQNLQQRYSALIEALRFAKKGQVIDRVSRMLMGFGSTNGLNLRDAKTIASQYEVALHALPMWAIERACIKFETGAIAPDSRIVEGVNRAFGPSTAQLHVVVEDICGEFYKEARQVHDALQGTVEYRPTPEERERLQRKLSEFAEELKSGFTLEEDEVRARRNQDWRSPSDDELRAAYPPKSKGVNHVNENQS